jgi:hypothetical protein
MSIIGLSQTSLITPVHSAISQSGVGHLPKAISAIGNALQSDDISSVQTALAAFQQSIANNSQAAVSNQPFGNYSQANLEYQRLISDVQSGDISDAKKAYANLLTALPRLKVPMLG